MFRTSRGSPEAKLIPSSISTAQHWATSGQFFSRSACCRLREWVFCYLFFRFLLSLVFRLASFWLVSARSSRACRRSLMVSLSDFLIIALRLPSQLALSQLCIILLFILFCKNQLKVFNIVQITCSACFLFHRYKGRNIHNFNDCVWR